VAGSCGMLCYLLQLVFVLLLTSALFSVKCATTDAVKNGCRVEQSGSSVVVVAVLC
jgi:hypothetical protein